MRTPARILALAIALALGAAGPAAAVAIPRPGPADPRLKVVDYDPDQVVAVRGVYGYQLVVEFGEDERLENVSIGDSLGWQVTPNRKANLLFLKPVEQGAAPTNMSVITNLRRYAFELTAGPSMGPNDPSLTFALRFRYPAEEAAKAAAEARAALREAQVAAPPSPTNIAYRYSGAGSLAPLRVYDDGQATVFRWRKGAQAPAVYARNAAGEEALVNYQARGDEMVVQQLAPEFVLRIGKAVGYVRIDGYGLNVEGGKLPKRVDWISVGQASGGPGR